MQHFGDLQPLGQPDFFADHPALGRYTAKRSRWRFAVGTLEVGFDRASEKIHAESAGSAAARASTPVGERLMIAMGVVSTALLLVIVGGWLWSSRGAIVGGETVSASIIDRGDAIAREHLSPSGAGPLVIPVKPRPARLHALIEHRKAAPAVAPSARALVPIASGAAIQPRQSAEFGRLAASPDEAIVSSGNFLLIPSVANAVADAMANGEAQSWAAGNYHGIVVVGDADRRDGKLCRRGTVLLRDGSSQGRTQSFDRCS